ncbi:Shedu anti-phage system protein SduA domain-containing protein [Nostoc sp. UHCC 0302]|uniref:Shedu anti-phage system protein SduA domain-containing protein n=1 Tax=Nostoc sp. UHCC 0302 TaxID=3134896 RepID=UPI00311CB8FF
MRFANAEEADYPPKKYRIDTHNFNGDDFGRLISLIRKDAGETEIDSFLRRRLSLLSFTSSFFRTGHHDTWIIPQPEIKPRGFANGAGKIPDYLFAGENSDGITWWVVDFKSPKHHLYKDDKNGRVVETAPLASGISQLRDYIRYCTEHQGFIRETLGLKSFTSPLGVIIIGRECELKKDLRKQAYKAQFNKDTQTIQIRTFDAFLHQIEFYSRTSYKLPFLAKLYKSIFVTDELSPWDRWCNYSSSED